MNQKIIFSQTLKQTFKLNHTLINSLDFLKLDNYEIAQLISKALQTNPFLEINTNNGEKVDYENNYIENISTSLSLNDELQKQLLTVPLPYDKSIMNFLIDSLNSQGFLSYSEEEYLSFLHINKETFYFHAHILQSLDPSGVGAFDIYDSICIQLRKLKKHNTYKMLRKYKEYILSYNYQNIMTHTSLTKDEIDNIYHDIRLCNLYPCSQYSKDNNNIIQPDISVFIDDNQIMIEPFNQPNIMINHDLYSKVKDNEQMRDYFKNASFLIENINKRNQSLLLISNALVNIQRGHFLYNDELIPCTLRDLSQLCGYHESTISRTLNNKYYLFNNEVYPLKNLMVSKTNMGDSSDAIKKAITLLIENENKNHPLSDQKLVEELAAMDLYCSRRAVTKYREQLQIASSFKRKNRI